MVWAPFSELRGRKLPLLVSLFGFSVFMVVVAVAKDLQTVMICRFWAGFFGSCSFTIVPAVFADFFDVNYRGVANTVFASAVFGSPNLAPFIGGFIAMTIGSRWTHYLMAILVRKQMKQTFSLCNTFPNCRKSWNPGVQYSPASRLLVSRDLCTSYSSYQSSPFTETDRELRNPCEARGAGDRS